MAQDDPAGIREVMDLIQTSEERTGTKIRQSEDRVTAKVDSLTAKIDLVVVNHEHRLTKAETQLEDVSATASDLGGRVSSLEQSRSELRGHFKLAAGIAAAVSALGGIGALIAAVH